MWRAGDGEKLYIFDYFKSKKSRWSDAEGICKGPLGQQQEDFYEAALYRYSNSSSILSQNVPYLKLWRRASKTCCLRLASA